MAEGKDIPIRITTTADTKGAEAAEEAIKDVTRESGRAAKVLPTLSDAQQESAVKSELQGQKFKMLTAEQNRVTASAFNMRAGLSNVGYQIQDFAVQTQMGVSATRAFAQQGPQLLSALGPWGIALGTIVALGAPLLGQLGAQKDAMDDVATAVNDATKETIEMQRAETDAANARASAEERNRAYAESLRRITDEGFEYLDVLRKEIDLLREKQGLENTVEEARGQRRIEEAGDDPVKQEQVRNQVRKEAQDREIRQLEEQIEKRRDLMERASEREASITIRGRNESGAFQSAAEDAAARALQAEQEKKLRDAEAAALRDAAEKQKGSTRARSLREATAAEEAGRAAGVTATEARAEESDFRRQAKDAADKAAAEATTAFNEANKLFQEINRRAREVQAKREVFAERDASGSIRETRVAKQEEERRQKEKDREEADRRREQERAAREAETAQRGIDRAGSDIASRAEGIVAGARDTAITREVRDAAAAVRDGGTTSGELGELGNAIRELAGAAVSASSETKAQIRQILGEIANLKGQIKTSRDGR